MKKAGRFGEKRTARWNRGWEGREESKGSARHANDMPFRRWLRFGGKKDPLLPRSLEWAMKNENTSMTQPFMRCRISKDSSHHAIFQKIHLLLPGCAHASAIWKWPDEIYRKFGRCVTRLYLAFDPIPDKWHGTFGHHFFMATTTLGWGSSLEDREVHHSK